MPDDKLVLNAHYGHNNIIEFHEFYDVVIATLDDISDTIMSLCGPKALYDLVVYERIHTGLMSNVFSNDGIHILKSIEYMSPIQAFITSYIRYIAEKVEAAAADGTSTAIILSTEFLSRALKVINTIRVNEDLDLKGVMDEIGAFSEFVVELFDYLRQFVADCSIDITTAQVDLKKKLIYQLAYTSSKGNDQLASFTVELFAELPELLYEQVNLKRNHTETTEPLSIEYPESDIIINVNPSANTRYNHKLNTELVESNIDLLPVVTMLDSTKVDDLIEYIKNVHDQERKLVVLVSGIDESGMMRLERGICHDRVTICRMTYFHPLFVNNPTEVRAILAVAGKSDSPATCASDYSEALIQGVSIRLANRCLYVNDLIPKGEGDSLLHPYFVIPGIHQPYDQLRVELEEQLKELKSAHNSSDLKHELNEFTRIYRMMTCSRFPILVIGGSTVEHLSMVNVVNDVLGVVSVAMKHGVVIDLIPKLDAAFNSIPLDSGCYMQAVQESIQYFARLTYQVDEEGPISDGLKPIPEELYSQLFYHDGNWLTIDGTNINSIQVVQSCKAIDETFKRLVETVPKLIMADKIIVPNSVMQRDSQGA